MSKVPKVKLEKVLTSLKQEGYKVYGSDFKYNNGKEGQVGIKLRFEGIEKERASLISSKAYEMLNETSSEIGSFEPKYNNGILTLTYRIKYEQSLFNEENKSEIEPAKTEIPQVRETKKSTPGCGGSFFKYS